MIILEYWLVISFVQHLQVFWKRPPTLSKIQKPVLGGVILPSKTIWAKASLKSRVAVLCLKFVSSSGFYSLIKLPEQAWLERMEKQVVVCFWKTEQHLQPLEQHSRAFCRLCSTSPVLPWCGQLIWGWLGSLSHLCLFHGGVVAWSAPGCFAAHGIGVTLPAELRLFLKSCVWLKAGSSLSPVWFVPNKWVNVILECSAEHVITTLCVGLIDLWKDDYNKRKQLSFEEMKLKVYIQKLLTY